MKKLYLSAVVLGAAMGAHAGFYEDSDVFPLGLRLTDFTSSVTLDKFDPNFGDLIGVTYTLESTFTGNVTVDSENPAPTLVTLTVAGTIRVRDGAITLLEVNPSTSDVSTLDPDSDVGPDFIGSDSRSMSATLNATDSDSASDAANLNWFTATILGETFTWAVDAKGLSGVLGSGNQASFSHQEATGRVTVRYEYATQVIPEASTYLAGLGLLGLLAVTGRRWVAR